MKFQGLIYIFFILIKKCTLEYCIGYTGVFKFKNGNMFGGLTAWGGEWISLQSTPGNKLITDLDCDFSNNAP